MLRRVTLLCAALMVYCGSGCALTKHSVFHRSTVESVIDESNQQVVDPGVKPVPAGESTGDQEPRYFASSSKTVHSTFATLVSDQLNFYSPDQIPGATFAFGTAAILGNTTIDQEFADRYQSDIRNEFSDDLSSVFKTFGEQWLVVPVYVGASCLGKHLPVDPRIHEWGDRSFRSMLVGVPPLLLLQKSIGSSRPNDALPSSHWNFWNDNNGASGHTFVGAVPFLVAAQLTENRFCKASLYFGSTLTGWSRINDNDHYLSQVIVGWWLAYAATRSVEGTNLDRQLRLVPLNQNDATGLGVEFKY